jgi:hypothetical protein
MSHKTQPPLSGWRRLKQFVKPPVMLVLMIIGFIVEFIIQLPFELIMALDRLQGRSK